MFEAVQRIVLARYTGHRDGRRTCMQAASCCGEIDVMGGKRTFAACTITSTQNNDYCLLVFPARKSHKKVRIYLLIYLFIA